MLEWPHIGIISGANNVNIIVFILVTVAYVFVTVYIQ